MVQYWSDIGPILVQYWSNIGISSKFLYIVLFLPHLKEKPENATVPEMRELVEKLGLSLAENLRKALEQDSGHNTSYTIVVGNISKHACAACPGARLKLAQQSVGSNQPEDPAKRGHIVAATSFPGMLPVLSKTRQRC